MRRAERPRGEHWMARVGETRDAVDRARSQGLRVIEWRKDRLEGTRGHRLARTGRAHEQEVVSASGRDLERALRRFLSGDVRGGDRVAWRGGPLRDPAR